MFCGVDWILIDYIKIKISEKCTNTYFLFFVTVWLFSCEYNNIAVTFFSELSGAMSKSFRMSQQGFASGFWY